MTTFLLAITTLTHSHSSLIVVAVPILELQANVYDIVEGFVNVKVAPSFRRRGGEKHAAMLILLGLEL